MCGLTPIELPVSLSSSLTPELILDLTGFTLAVRVTRGASKSCICFNDSFPFFVKCDS